MKRIEDNENTRARFRRFFSSESIRKDFTQYVISSHTCFPQTPKMENVMLFDLVLYDVNKNQASEYATIFAVPNLWRIPSEFGE